MSRGFLVIVTKWKTTCIYNEPLFFSEKNVKDFLFKRCANRFMRERNLAAAWIDGSHRATHHFISKKKKSFLCLTRACT